ncbi:MAG: heavy metal sensor histidine kinase [Gammaproteobacteria bacterium]|nr:heavy metal sensor histidine kinase [Gammaproteobacteria bacterium]
MMRLLSSISLRISLIFTFFTALILLMMSIVIHQLVMHHFEKQDRALLEGKVALIENILQQIPQNQPLLIQQLNDALVGHHGLMVQIERPIGTPLLATVAASIPDHPTRYGKLSPLTEWQINQKDYRGIIVKHSQTESSESNRIVVGIETTDHSHFLDEFRQQLLMIGGVATMSLMILGWLAARRGLRPAQSMALVAEGISAQHLTGRLDENHAPTELKPLATAFNSMLDRLEDAVGRLSDFSSDLAHELRTPINTLMTQTQVCLSKPRDIPTYQDVLFSNLEEYERLARMIADMLFLAKADHGLSLPHLQKVDLRQEVIALFEFYDALAADKGMKLNLSGSAVMQGDQLMLRRALSNLIANAIRYGKGQGNISIHLNEQEESTVITIQNEAEPLSSEQVSRLFDRFYRTDTSRQRTEEGSGLGLAITKSIVQAHGGQIEAFSDQDSVMFKIGFERQK